MIRRFSDLVKNIREQTLLSQSDFANTLDVSTIYISKIETGQKKASKQFIEKLSELLDIHPSAMAPFLFLGDYPDRKLSDLENKLISLGQDLQDVLIKKKIKNGNFSKNQNTK